MDELPETVSATAAIYATPTAGARVVVSKILLGMVGDSLFHEAVGQVAIRHGQMDYMLRLTIKSLTGRAIGEVLAETERTHTSELRKKVQRECETRFGPSPALDTLNSLLTRARDLSERRNRIMHDVCALTEGGEPVVLVRGQTQIDLYPTEEVRGLSDETRTLTIELDSWRIAHQIHGSPAA